MVICNILLSLWLVLAWENYSNLLQWCSDLSTFLVFNQIPNIWISRLYKKENAQGSLELRQQTPLEILVFTELQDSWGWKEPLEMIESHLLLKQTPNLNSLTQAHVQVATEDFQGRDYTTSLGTLQSKKCFLTFRKNLPCSSMCPSPLVLALGAKWS